MIYKLLDTLAQVQFKAWAVFSVGLASGLASSLYVYWLTRQSVQQSNARVQQIEQRTFLSQPRSAKGQFMKRKVIA